MTSTRQPLLKKELRLPSELQKDTLERYENTCSVNPELRK